VPGGIVDGHPFADKLRSLWVPAWDGATGTALRNWAPDLIAKNLTLPVVGTTPAMRSIVQGPAGFTASGGWSTNTVVPYDPSTSIPVTLAFMGVWGGSITNYPSFYGFSNGSLYSGYCAIIPYSTNQLGFNANHNTGGNELLLNLGTLVAGQPFLAVCTIRSATDHEAWAINLATGVVTKGTSSINLNSVNQVVDREGLGYASYNGATNNYLDGLTAAAWMWNRGFSSAELKAFLAAPWDMAVPVSRFVRGVNLSSGGTTYNESASDTLTASDSGVAAQVSPAAGSDTATVGDSGVSVGVIPGSGTDTASVGDSGTTKLTAVAAATESLSATDSAAVTGIWVVSSTDGITASDSGSSKLTTIGVATDTASAADSGISTQAMVASSTDGLTATDSGIASYTFQLSASDSIVSTDGSSSSQVAFATGSDTAVVSDSGTGEIGATTYNVSASDSVTATDIGSNSQVMGEAFTDSVSVIDSGVSVSTISVMASETLSTSDTGVAALVRVGIGSDGLTASESSVTFLARSGVGTDSVSLGESHSLSLTTFGVASDSIVVSDSGTGSLGAQAYDVAASDGLVASDSGLALIISSSAATDSVVPSDAGSGLRTIFGLGTDVVSVSDSGSTKLVAVAAQWEVLFASDSSWSSASYHVEGFDNLTALDYGIGTSSSVNPRVPTLPAIARSSYPGAIPRGSITPAINRTS